MVFTAETLYNPQQVSDIVGISVSTLANWRSQGKGPPWLKVGRKIWYLVADFEKWMEGLKRGTQRTERQMALPVQSERTKILREHRFGRHRTKQDQSIPAGSPSPPFGDGRQGGSAETGSSPI